MSSTSKTKSTKQVSSKIPGDLDQSLKTNGRKGVFLSTDKENPGWSYSEVHAKKHFGEGKFKWVDNPHYVEPTKKKE